MHFSLARVSRGDKSPLELFLSGLRTWGKGLIALVAD